MSDDSLSTRKRTRTWKARALFMVLLVGVVLIVTRYRREIYVYAMIDCGGLYLNIMATPHVLIVHRELLSEELADADSDTDEIEILRNNLQHRYEWVRTHAIEYIENHHIRLAPKLASELVTVLEKDYGGRVRRTLMLLYELPSISESEAQRLLALVNNGKPDWRQSHALMLLKKHQSSLPEHLLRRAGLDRAINSDNFLVREAAVALLLKLSAPPKIDNVGLLIDSEYKESQMAGLRFLDIAEHESAVQHAKSLYHHGRPETKQLALSILERRDPEFARKTSLQSLTSNDTSISAGALLTLRRLEDSVPEDHETKIIEALEKDIMSTRFVGQQRMRRLWIMYDLDADRAIDCAKEMVDRNQLGTFPDNFLKEVIDAPQKMEGEVVNTRKEHLSSE